MEGGHVNCTEHDKGIFAQCAQMYSDIGDTYAQAEPRWDWILLAIGVLTVMLLADIAHSLLIHNRKEPTNDRYAAQRHLRRTKGIHRR